MTNLEKQINQNIQKERQKILDEGKKLRGKFDKVIKEAIADYDLTEYDMIPDNNFWMIRLKPKGTINKKKAELEKSYKNTAAKERFKKRVKSGEIEKSIRNWIEKEFEEGYRLEHSRSIYNSESFYIVHQGEKIIKLSLHNTASQEFDNNTPFIDLNEYTSTIELKKDITNKINAL